MLKHANEDGIVPIVMLQETATVRSRFKFHSDRKKKEAEAKKLKERQEEVIETLKTREQKLESEIQEIEIQYEDLEQELFGRECEREINE